MKKKNTVVETLAVLLAIIIVTAAIGLVATSCARKNAVEDKTETEIDYNIVENGETDNKSTIEAAAKRLTALYRKGKWDGSYTAAPEDPDGEKAQYWVDSRLGTLNREVGDDEISREILGTPATPDKESLEGGWSMAVLPQNGLAAFRKDDFSALIIYRGGEEVNRVPLGSSITGEGIETLANGNLVVVHEGLKAYVCDADAVHTGPLYELTNVSDVVADYTGGPIKVATFDGDNYLVAEEGPKKLDSHFIMLPDSEDLDARGVEIQTVEGKVLPADGNMYYYMYANSDSATYTLALRDGGKAIEISRDVIYATNEIGSVCYITSDGIAHRFTGGFDSNKTFDLYKGINVLGWAGSGELVYPIVSEEESNDYYEGYPVYNIYKSN